MPDTQYPMGNMPEYSENPDYTKSKLGYEDNTAKTGKDKYNTVGGDGSNAHRGTKKAQDGQVEDTKMAARAHDWNEDGRVNGDPEKGTSKGKSL